MAAKQSRPAKPATKAAAAESAAATTAAVADAFVISRTFAAPLSLVYAAFTDPSRMRHWWGPKGASVIASTMDFRPGGTYHYGMRMPDGAEIWGRFVYREIVDQQRLVWVGSFSDKAGGLARHPFSPSWPIEMLTTLQFFEVAGRTTLTITWVPINPTDVEMTTFRDGMPSMANGWGGTLDQLGAYLSTAAAAPSTVQSYLFFDGRCEEAIAFYKAALGAEVEMLMRYKDTPVPADKTPPGGADKIIHASLRIGATTVMASDGFCGGSPTFKGFALSLAARDDAHADRLFAALIDGGEVKMPLGKTFFSPRFGMVADRFGVTWMVIVP